MNIPDNVKDIMNVLERNGFEAYIIGGAVRDYIMGCEPHDYDIFTNAEGEQILKLFPQGKVLGSEERQAKILTVIVGSIEVSSYRANGNRTEIGKTLISHLETCDFTINAMAMDKDFNITDPFNAREDIFNKELRFVGDPIQRVKEDPIRLFRGIRFLAKYDFTTDEGNVFEDFNRYMRNIPVERIRDEFIKIIQVEGGLEALNQFGMLRWILPEFDHCVGMKGGNYHSETVDEHLFYCVNEMRVITNDYKLLLVAFLHDIGKGLTQTIECSHSIEYDGEGYSEGVLDNYTTEEIHFYEHEKIGSEVVKQWMTTFKFSNNDIKFVTSLILLHMFSFKSENGTNILDKTYIKFFNKLEDANISIIEYVSQLYADNQGNKTKPKIKFIEFLHGNNIYQRYMTLKFQKMPFKLNDLDISGIDIMNLGVHGKEIGVVLHILFDSVCDGKIKNRKDYLINEAKHIINKSKK